MLSKLCLKALFNGRPSFWQQIFPLTVSLTSEMWLVWSSRPSDLLGMYTNVGAALGLVSQLWLLGLI